MDYELVKKALREIRKEIKKVSSRKLAVTSTTYCCGSCHSAKLQSEGYDGFISAKIFNSGMNKNINNVSRFERLYFNWDLNEVELNLVIDVLSKFFEVLKPESHCCCIEIKNKTGKEVACCG